MLTRRGPSATITCTADARPEPSYEIILNGRYVTEVLQTDPMYTIPKVNSSHVGNYTCVAVNILGNVSSDSHFLSLEGTNYQISAKV